MRCADLDPELHEILTLISTKKRTKKGCVKATPSGIADELGQLDKHIRMLLSDLEGDGFVKFDDQGHLKLVKSCECVIENRLVDSEGGSVVHPAPARARPRGIGDGDPPHLYYVEGSGDLLTPGKPKNSENSENWKNSTGPTKFVGRRSVRHKARPGDLAGELTAELEVGLRNLSVEYKLRLIDPVNFGAVRNQISKWLTSGEVDAGLVRAMIAEFTSDPHWLTKGTLPWKSFLGQRQALVERVEEIHGTLGPGATAEDWLDPGDPDGGVFGMTAEEWLAPGDPDAGVFGMTKEEWLQ